MPISPDVPAFVTSDLDLACTLLSLNLTPVIHPVDGRHIYLFPYSKYVEADIRLFEAQFYAGDLQVRALAMSKARQRIISAQKSGRQL